MKFRKPTYFFIFVLFVINISLVVIILTKRQQTITVQDKNPLALINQSIPDNWKIKENLPGNSFETAFNLTPGFETQGTLNPGNIVDYDFFYLDKPSKIIITVTNLPSDFGMVFYDNSFQEIGHTLRSGSVGGTTTLNLQPGKYYLKILANYTEVTNNSYTVRLDVLPFPE